MSLKLYDSATKTKKDFQPLEPGKVSMYCCGPTVYDYLHVGNFRGAVFYNFVRNWMEALGYSVTYVYNFTDVDDKILDRAQKEGVEASEIAERFIAAFKEDFAALKLTPHDHNPRVTEHMGDIVQLIQDLIAKGRAYAVEGEVFFSIPSFVEYGKLSHRKPEDMLSGARIEVDPKKKSPLDFTLWKPAKAGEASWPSPWGDGRPGWHIECSAMSRALLGEQIDIHGGGLDLVFPHHENEIAQSEGASDKPYVGCWVHNNMFTFGGAKMSKSLGNIRTMRSFLEKYDGEIFKYLVLSVHYRSESDFTEQTINNSIAALGRVYSAMLKAESFAPTSEKSASERKSLQGDALTKFRSKVDEAGKSIHGFFNDDFATPQAMAQVFEVVRLFNQLLPANSKKNAIHGELATLFVEFVREIGKPLALFQQEPKAYLQVLDSLLLKIKNIERSQVEDLISARKEARANKDYGRSDEIRDQLQEWGIEIRDSAQGTEWEVRKGGNV